MSAMTYLEGAVLEVLLDVGREIIILLHVLLHGDLALKLCDELLICCDHVSCTLKQH